MITELELKLSFSISLSLWESKFGIWSISVLLLQIAKTYEKVFHFWQFDKGDTLPIGPPQLMMAITADGQLNPELAAGEWVPPALHPLIKLLLLQNHQYWWWESCSKTLTHTEHRFEKLEVALEICSGNFLRIFPCFKKVVLKFSKKIFLLQEVDLELFLEFFLLELLELNLGFLFCFLKILCSLGLVCKT